jgi:hypothetical protein
MLCAAAERQANLIPALQKLHQRRGSTFDMPDNFAAVPTDAFRTLRLATFPAHETVQTFCTSGTTSGARGEHHFRDVSLYKLSALMGSHPLCGGAKRVHLLLLAPSRHEVPDSSLSFMLDDFSRYGLVASSLWGIADGELQIAEIERFLSRSREPREVVIACGTSFAWVHFLDASSQRFVLPEGSAVMQTGGYKGKSRELDKAQMRTLLSERLGVQRCDVISEYSMTELSSQLWGDSRSTRENKDPEQLWAPPWLRVTARDPRTLERLQDGSSGILRFDDLANLDSVVSVQTADVGVVRGDRVELIGRDPNAVPRGCSLALEEMLP